MIFVIFCQYLFGLCDDLFWPDKYETRYKCCIVCPICLWIKHSQLIDIGYHNAMVWGDMMLRAVYQYNNVNDTLITSPAYEAECMSIKLCGFATMNVAKTLLKMYHYVCLRKY